jgi:DNA repair and recombination protein RAD52
MERWRREPDREDEMTFTPEQVSHLTAKLDASNVKERAQAGQKLSYIEGWHAIAEANRIFGFHAWNRLVQSLRQLGDPREVDGKYRVAYMATVRIIVTTDDGREIIRDGSGYGSGIDRDLGGAHESAIKEAETDAMKRALMTFGNPFGLALYDKSKENVETHPKTTAPKQDRPAINPAYVVKGAKDADDYLKRLIALVAGAPDAATVQAINDANRPALDKLATVDRPKWDAAMQALADRTSTVMDRKAA